MRQKSGSRGTASEAAIKYNRRRTNTILNQFHECANRMAAQGHEEPIDVSKSWQESGDYLPESDWASCARNGR